MSDAPPRRRGSRPGRTALLALAFAALFHPFALHLAGPVYDGFRHLALDGLFWLRGPLPPAPELVVVSVNEDTFEYLGKNWPPREGDFARAVRNIKADGARAVGVDFIVGDPYSTAPADSDEVALRDALALPPVAVCAAKFETFTRVETVNGVRNLHRMTALTTPRAFYDGAYRRGMISASADADGAIRRHAPLVALDGGAAERSFVAELLLVASGTSGEVAVRDGRTLEVGPFRAPADARGRFLINYPGPTGHIPTVPFYVAADGLFPPGAFRDKVVLIGPGHREMHDFYPYPFLGAPCDPSGQLMPGVEVMASACDTLLSGRGIREAPRATVALVAGGFAFPVALAILATNGLLAAIFALAAASGAFALSAWAFIARGLFLNPFPSLAGVAVASLVALLLKTRVLEADARRVRALFARFVEPQVAEALVAEGVSFPLKGRHMEVCVVFGDVRGFTTQSVGKSPEQVFHELNGLFEIVVDEAFASGGTVDKFIGDCVMLVYGAPVPMAGREARALAALRRIRARLKAWNGEREAAGLPAMVMGFGMATGVAMCGNLGAARRMEYTAVGETVNLASRLQGKAGPYEIVLSESAAAALPDEAPRLRATSFQLKGLSEPTPAWILGDEEAGVGGPVTSG